MTMAALLMLTPTIKPIKEMCIIMIAMSRRMRRRMKNPELNY